MFKPLLSLIACCLLAAGLHAQSNAEALATQHVLAKAEKAKYSEADLRDLVVDYSYTDEKIGVTYVYLQQQVGNLPIRNALASIAIKDGRVVHASDRFVDDVAERLTSVTAKLDDKAAMQAAAASLGERMPSFVARAEEATGPQGQRLYAVSDFTREPIAVEDYFLLGEDGKLHRAYGVTIDHKGTHKLYRISVDAGSGAVLETEQMTIECTFSHNFLGAQHSGDCDVVPAGAFDVSATSASVNDGSSYRVFAWPAESPNHGPHVLVNSPADSIASPFGWHDTNGATGPEFTITRGNNTHAYIDADDANAPSEAEPDGGASLTFDFPYDVDTEPEDQSLTTVTNLFYTVNQMHDFTYGYGFDEPAGNFQQNNYGNGGQGGDYVFSESQDGSGTNNANFSTPGDGSNGRMQMFLWNANNQGNALTATSPSEVEGRTFGELGLPETISWGSGATISETTNVVAGVQDVRDDVANVSFTDGCENIVNAAELAGKIALVDRGTCQFGSKALNAQNAGAVAVIICNFEDPAAGMLGGDDGLDVNVPTFMLPLSGCQTIRGLAQQYPDFELTIEQPADLPTVFVSGSYDNGIVAHEFGHGVSTRLTGGPNTSCLGSEEQMGEGWSDFFSLVTSAKMGDVGETGRGIGTFAERQGIDGPGIRNYPYSTDMSINPVTYADVANGEFSVPHGVGSIWCSMLWDLYWAMVEKHGFDEDQFHGDGGNNRAIWLVMQGMKLQPCSPGFQDGRDAIIAADALLYNGENEKLIWEVFARRGLGFDASQGDPDDRFDGSTSFVIPPVLANEAYLTKTVTEEIMPGDDVNVSLNFANWLDADVPAATVTDVLPAGATLIASSVTQPYTLNGDVLSFEFTDLSEGDIFDIAYTYTSPSDAPDVSYFQAFADTDEESDWDSENPLEDQSNTPRFWEMIDTDGSNDDVSWWVEGTTDGSAPYFAMTEDQEFTVTGANPMFSFYTKYQMDPSAEGGIIEIYNPDLQLWEVIPAELYRRNGVSTELPYQTFVIPFLEGFAGDRLAEWERVLIDLTPYLGRTIQMRWRYGRADGLGVPAGEGWYVDELAHMDAITYNTEATLSIAGRDDLVVTAPNIGTFVANGTMVDVVDAFGSETTLRAFPNPTNGELTLLWEGDATHAGQVELYSATGQRVGTIAVASGLRRLELSLEGQPNGLYTARVVRGEVEQTLRLVKQ